ncbi:hypothetical protein OHC33_002713 [Knufia fluminis]|uniref:SHSP domain-containing protein n=1 Tax=Knufia fluminis TaxID=191047 RepID=A0AAN8EKW3_9EURO|nr:hypothetical protein OHC33_002713 [Knufia fluminis]
MSSLFYPHRNHHRSYGGHHNYNQQLTPYGRAPTSLFSSPWDSSPFNFNFDQPFHAPFLSLFNDTFSQLDRLSNELNGRLSDNDSRFNMLTLSPKFDIKETEKEFVLEGELPGVEKKDISLEFADDNTLVLKTRVEKVRKEGREPQSQSQQQEQGQIEDSAKNDSQAQDTQMSGANQESTSTTNQNTSTENDTTVATTNQNQNNEVSKPTSTTQYHLTERSIGTFQRAFSLPGELKHEEVKASLRNGVLTVTVPKVVKDTKEPEKRNRSVTVEAVGEEEGEKAKL